MKTVLIGNSKGGQGKTCLAYNFAVCALLEGRKVAVVDADAPQYTLSKMLEVRSDVQDGRKSPKLVVMKGTSKDSLRKELVSLREDEFDFVLVDVGGHWSTGIIDATLFVNLWIIPTEPTMENFWGIEDSIRISTDAVVKVLANRVPLRDTVKLKRNFEQAAQKLPMMKSQIHVRPFIPTASYDGMGVTEYRSGSDASKEMWAAYHEMMEVLKNA